jgi:hypothetical protein
MRGGNNSISDQRAATSGFVKRDDSLALGVVTSVIVMRLHLQRRLFGFLLLVA